MKVGILEWRDYPFIQDVIRKLGDLEVEFFSAADQELPPKKKYGVIVDRLSFQDQFLRQSMMLASLGGVYVINNPFATSVNNKMLHHLIIDSLGVKQPKTIFLPKIEGVIEELSDFIKEPDMKELKKSINLPCILKPFDGYAWENVYTVTTFSELENLYNSMKGSKMLLLQEKIEYTDYFRVFCINKKDVLVTKWVPKPLGLGQYMVPEKGVMEKHGERIRDITIRLNRIIDFDFNAVEWCIDEDGELFIIEAMNDVPDVDKRFMPNDCYWWLVDKFCDCIREKAREGTKNNMSPFANENPKKENGEIRKNGKN